MTAMRISISTASLSRASVSGGSVILMWWWCDGDVGRMCDVGYGIPIAGSVCLSNSADKYRQTTSVKRVDLVCVAVPSVDVRDVRLD